MNAIILAAGLGSRFEEYTENNHKSLFPIQGTPNIERTILFLIDANISPIYIITGHMSDKFNYLKNRYIQVKLINNPYYEIFNSIYTFSLALPHFSNSWVIDADTVLTENIFKIKVTSSTYFTILRNSTSLEWCPIVRNNKVEDIIITNEARSSLSGISYWDKKDCLILEEVYKKYMTQNYLTNPKLYWDDIAKDNLNMLNVTAVNVPSNSLFEMDTIEEYRAIIKYLNVEQNKYYT
ncbi:NTP transferase domain-containing protein [Lysinibacillus sp. fls2-241-R2A-57]|uniref:NTP transferase domain-containing protein n=1 Tax=Lysinibacillus sp. fls2-241-R2A-57 TaxID=3040292 RepID=UPI002555D2B7|nr:NTP transferase domain-containing protein [Lysinibacillus sp. fls2-241-R2A-57]